MSSSVTQWANAYMYIMSSMYMPTYVPSLNKDFIIIITGLLCKSIFLMHRGEYAVNGETFCVNTQLRIFHVWAYVWNGRIYSEAVYIVEEIFHNYIVKKYWHYSMSVFEQKLYTIDCIRTVFITTLQRKEKWALRLHVFEQFISYLHEQTLT